MRKVKLTKGKFALVDDEDYEKLLAKKWHLHSCGYACSTVKKDGGSFTVMMHREIMNPCKDLEIDHRNHNRLDNRKKNLKICSRSDNLLNGSSHKDSKSKFRGVSWCKQTNKWRAQLRIKGISYNIGRFNTELKAARAYNKKLKLLISTN